MPWGIMTRTCCFCACLRQLSCSKKQRCNFDMEQRQQYRTLHDTFCVLRKSIIQSFVSHWRKQKTNDKCANCFFFFFFLFLVYNWITNHMGRSVKDREESQWQSLFLPIFAIPHKNGAWIKVKDSPSCWIMSAED